VTRGMLLVERLGQVPAAEADFRKAADLFDGLAASFPAIPKYQTDAAIGRYNLACWLGDAGRFDEKEKPSARLSNSGRDWRPPAPQSWNHRSKLAIILTDLADILQKTQPHARGGTRLSSGPADLRLRLSKDSPNVPWNFIQAGDLLSRAAGLAALSWCPHRGRVNYRRKRSPRCEPEWRWPPPTPTIGQRVSTSQVALIETLIRLREHEDAARAVLGARLIRLGLGAAVLPGWLAHRTVRAIAGRRLPAELTPVAAIWPKPTPDRAVELLREAKKRGYSDIESSKSDHSFDSIRSRAPDFSRAFFAGLESHLEPKRNP